VLKLWLVGSFGRGIGPSQRSLLGIRTGNLSGVLMEPIWGDGKRLIPHAALLFGYSTVIVATINTLKTNLVCLFVCFPGVTTHCGCIFHSPVAGLASSFPRFLDHTQRRATFGRTPLDE
jgi:hypothetical protein